MPDYIDFRQVNMHKAEIASVELNRIVGPKPAVCMITEPCAAFNRVSRVPPNHTCIPGITLPSRPRTAIYVPRGSPHVFLEQLSNPDCTVILLDTKRGKILLASCYLDSKKPVVQEWLTKLIRFIDSKQYPSLISLDCNTHSQLYGPETNDRGKIFEEFILENGLHVKNRGDTPTFHDFRNGGTIETYIDVTLSKFLMPLQNWRVHSHEFNGSDHHSITWTLPTSRPDPPLIRPCYKGRRESWRMFVEKVPNEKNMAALFRIAQRRDRRSINTLLKADGSLTDPGLETIQCLTETHFPAATPGTNPINHDTSHKLLTTEIQGKYESWINEPFVRKAFKKFKPYKAAGLDGLKPVVFQHLPDNAISVITLIFQACIALTHTPEVWRRTKVIFLPKPGKKSYDIGKSYRPISLSNIPLKALERLGVWKVDVDIKDKPIHQMQHGFTKGKSTESAISNTADFIEQHLFEGLHCLGLFLDISSAFDSISIDHIRDSLLEHDADAEFVAWYYSYLGNRLLQVDLHGERAELTTAVGFPQGGVCSARFWLIAFDKAIRIINSRGIIGNGYADDCSALIGGDHTSNMIEAMQAMLDRLVAWGNTCGLRFNAQKTVAVMFTRSKREFTHLVRMDGELIPYSDTVVYLGVTMDKELKWKAHIENKITKAKGLLMKMASITSSYWGPKPKLLRWAYTGIVRPMLTYGAMTWGHVLDEEDFYDTWFRRLNRLAMNTIVKVPRSTPTRGMELILGVTPLILHIKREGLTTYNRLQLPVTWDGVQPNLTYSVAHRRYWEYHAEDAGIQDFQANSDSCMVPRPELKFILDTESFVNMADCQKRLDWNVYTDGSKMEGKVGAGVYILCGGVRAAELSVRLPDDSTVYQAEMMAIRKAARILADIPNLT